ncbi:MAG: respiratory nitrate reductase subunit gamma [Candidatus Omnitrophica bacterium]|nr:respiratory nitrate reductase subunit gamma [Candidatus Omnitrophota bacterium]
MNASDILLFIVLPYSSIIVFLGGVFFVMRNTPFKVSSLSSQFLERDALFFGSVPFHVGMLVVFLLHLSAFLIPKTVLSFNSFPVRLMILETTGFVFAMSFLIGIIILLLRRMISSRVRAVTTWVDIVVELMLLYQVILGCTIALNFRWGSSWFAADLSPYLWSLIKLNPHTDAIIAMPLVIKTHVVTAFLILLMIPFSRLMHLLMAPFHYMWRPYQQVIWNWDRKKINDPNIPWGKHAPKNT